ncbi:MAG: energy transducer TonB [Gammaproteobacteria bacterium]|nr:MAG: energy transducer TonB [Gammaproteobacteria bacterium]
MSFKKFDTINVIPFIDIMLVLLAIVLTTATFIANGELEITLPEARAEAAQPDPDVVAISIDRDASIHLDSHAISLGELKQRLDELPPTTPVMLSVDEDTAFRHFVSVVDLLRELHMDRLSIMTRKPG